MFNLNKVFLSLVLFGGFASVVTLKSDDKKIIGDGIVFQSPSVELIQANLQPIKDVISENLVSSNQESCNNRGNSCCRFCRFLARFSSGCFCYSLAVCCGFCIDATFDEERHRCGDWCMRHGDRLLK